MGQKLTIVKSWSLTVLLLENETKKMCEKFKADLVQYWLFTKFLTY